jgi:selT/selW/selH-like putative selenoprotein
MLESRAPELSVSGSNYPTSAAKALLSRLVVAVQVAAIALALAGEHLLPARPAWLQAMQANKAQSCLMAWIVGNMLYQNLSTTGAFEVHFDGQTVFSKLESGRAPDLQSVVAKVLQLYAEHQSG